MLKFCNGISASLATHLFNIKIVQTSEGQTPVLEQIFPFGQADEQIMRDINLFVFPDPNAIESRSFFTFLVGDAANDFYMGFVQYTSILQGKCILTKYYYPDLFQTILLLPQNEMINIVAEISTPQIRNQVIIGPKKFTLDSGKQKQKLMEQMFNIFTPFDVSKIIVGLMTSRHIFVVCGKASQCSRIVAGLSLLLEPFLWTMGTIPILPVKLKDMVMVPVPTIMGITNVECICDGSVAPHVCANIDTHVVIDNPPFELNSAVRFSILHEQATYHTDMTKTLDSWKKSPGFPHKIVSLVTQRFIAGYLQIYTGPCPSSQMFLENIHKLPETMKNSQVMHELFDYANCSPERKAVYQNWFSTVFMKDISMSYNVIVDINAEIARYDSMEFSSSGYNSSGGIQPGSPISPEQFRSAPIPPPSSMNSFSAPPTPSPLENNYPEQLSNLMYSNNSEEYDTPPAPMPHYMQQNDAPPPMPHYMQQNDASAPMPQYAQQYTPQYNAPPSQQYYQRQNRTVSAYIPDYTPPVIGTPPDGQKAKIKPFNNFFLAKQKK